MRTDSANTTASAADNVPILLLVEMHFGSGTGYFCNAGYTFKWNGNSYLGLGNLGSIDAIEEGNSIQSYGAGFKISGVDPAKIEIAMNEDYQNKPVFVRIAILDESYNIVGTPTLVFSGLMDRMPITLGSSASITVTAESRLVDWDRARIRYYTDADQQSFFPGDLGFQYVNQSADKEITWGYN
jgi:hypothetical protein